MKLTLAANIHCHIGIHDGPGEATGSGRLMLDFGTEPAIVVIHNTANSSVDLYRPVVRLLADDAATMIHIQNAPGGVGIATEKPGETSEVLLITVSDRTGVARVFVGEGATVPTFTQYGGDNLLRIGAAMTAIIAYGGQLVLEGGQLITAMTIENDAYVIDRSRRALGLVQVTTCNHNGGTLDLTQHTEARKYGTYNMKRGAVLIVDPDTMTFDVAFNLPGGPSTLSAL